MSEYNNTIAFWKRKPRDNDEQGKKYPNYTGKMTVEGKAKDVSLWVNMRALEKRKENDTDMNGKIQDPYQPKGN